MSCATGTFEALNWMMFGGVMPGGRMRVMVFVTDAICAMAAPRSVPGWKYTRSSPMPGMDCDSMRSMPPTVVENARSEMNVTRRSMSSAERPG